MLKKENNEIKPDQDFKIDIFKPKDAPGVTGLFLSVYGDKYPVNTFLDPELLIRENNAQRVISSVARTSSGDIVGHNALFQSAPNKRIYESGAGLVHKYYRGGQGIFTDLVAHGISLSAQKPDIDGIFGESVCNHVFSQKMTRKSGFITTAIEVDLMPAAAYAKEKSARGRVTSLLDFKICKHGSHKIFIPGIYKNLLDFIYSKFDDTREFSVADKALPDSEPTKIDTQYFDFAKVARMTIWQMGKDFDKYFTKKEKQVIDLGASVIQVWINLGSAWNQNAVNILRKKQYFTGGILPRWFGTDGLLMMKTLHQPHWEEIKIHFDHAKKILNFIKKDWQGNT